MAHKHAHALHYGSVLGNSGVTQQDIIDLFVNGGGFYPGWIYDITDPTANNVERDGTGADVSNGSFLGRRIDLSGNNNHSVAVSDDARPTWLLESGEAWQKWDGSDDETETALPGAGGPYSIFFTHKTPAKTRQVDFYSGGSNAAA